MPDLWFPIKSLLPLSLRATLVRARRNRRYGQLYERFKAYTMIDRRTYGDNMELTERVKQVSGAVVECGVWRGGMCAGLASLLGPEREYWLFDSFVGLPPAKAVDGQQALDWQKDTMSPTYFENCAAEESFAAEAMRLSGATKAQTVKGWFNETLPGRTIPGGIALLRLDGDWYESTMTCLEALYPQVVSGGLIVIDDYYAWDGCSRAVHDYLSKISSADRLRNLHHVCYIEKRTPLPSPTR